MITKVVNPEIRKLVRIAEKSGWASRLSKGGHIRLQHPTNGLVFGPSTPSDHRAIKNFRSELKKRGVDC